jgi:hypothetical protein
MSFLTRQVRSLDEIVNVCPVPDLIAGTQNLTRVLVKN